MDDDPRKAALDARIKELADAMPPLTGERRARLASLLRPADPNSSRQRAIQAAVKAAPPLSDENLRAIAALMSGATVVDKPDDAF